MVNYGSVKVKDALLLMLLYCSVAFVLAGLSWLFYRDMIKASLLAFFLLAFNFFFGSIQDLFKDHWHVTSIFRYRIILPVCLLILVFVIIWLKRSGRAFSKFIRYLNLVLALLVVIDLGWLIIKTSGNEKKLDDLTAVGFTKCDTCNKPDVILIIADQYTGNTALKKVFGFDNSSFENELRLRGFHIAENSSSNYNLTPFSIASTLNMDYLDLKKGPQTYNGVSYSYHLIRNSRVLNFFSLQGYQFYNCSIFDFDDQPAHKYGSLLPYGTKLITSQTFISRIWKDMRLDILKGKFGFKSLQKKIAYEHLNYNNDIITLTGEDVAIKSSKPKFVYTHLMMPHYPYYFDSKGNPLPVEKLGGIANVNTNDFIGYLQYSNKRLLELVDEILKRSATPPVILLLGDHGFRNSEKKTDGKYDFVNLSAIYFPNGDYSRIYDSISNVNQFRVVFNTFFNQRFPLLKDSTVNVWD
jgi:hypothetical protein